jgi:hypothetical protein
LDLQFAAILMGYLEAARNGTLRAVFDGQFHFDRCGTFEALVPGGGEKSRRDPAICSGSGGYQRSEGIALGEAAPRRFAFGPSGVHPRLP